MNSGEERSEEARGRKVENQCYLEAPTAEGGEAQEGRDGTGEKEGQRGGGQEEEGEVARVVGTIG